MTKYVFSTYDQNSKKILIHVYETEDSFEMFYSHFKHYFDDRAHFQNLISDFQDLVDYMEMYSVTLSDVIKVGKRQ